MLDRKIQQLRELRIADDEFQAKVDDFVLAIHDAIHMVEFDERCVAPSEEFDTSPLTRSVIRHVVGNAGDDLIELHKIALKDRREAK